MHNVKGQCTIQEHSAQHRNTVLNTGTQCSTQEHSAQYRNMVLKCKTQHMTAVHNTRIKYGTHKSIVQNTQIQNTQKYSAKLTNTEHTIGTQYPTQHTGIKYTTQEYKTQHMTAAHNTRIKYGTHKSIVQNTQIQNTP